MTFFYIKNDAKNEKYIYNTESYAGYWFFYRTIEERHEI